MEARERGTRMKIGGTERGSGIRFIAQLALVTSLATSPSGVKGTSFSLAIRTELGIGYIY
jgi:hypothetical protein